MVTVNLGGGDIEKVAVLHLGRCGSHLINNTIKLYNPSNVEHDLDIFTKPMDTPIFPYLVSRIQVSTAYKKKAYFFETMPFKYSNVHMSDEVRNMTPREYIDTIKGKAGINKFIIMDRKNYLRRYVSAMVAKKNGYWHSNTEVNNITKIDLGDVNWIVNTLFPAMDEWYLEMSEILKDDDLLKISYEEDIKDDPRIAYDKVLKFVNLESEQEPCFYLKKTNPFPLREILENYDEVAEGISGTKYEWMLDGE